MGADRLREEECKKGGAYLKWQDIQMLRADYAGEKVKSYS
jgi:hypothetical protein